MIEQLAAWMPAPILAGVMIALGKWVASSLGRRLDVMERTSEKTNELLVNINAQLATFATKAELTNLGNRLDEKITTLRERLARLEGERE